MRYDNEKVYLYHTRNIEIQLYEAGGIMSLIII